MFIWHFLIYTYIIDKKKEYFNHQNCHLFKKIICQPVCWWWPIFNALAASTQRQFNSMEDQPTVKTLSSLWGYCCDLWGQCNNKIQFLLIFLYIFLDFPIPGVTHMEIVEAGLVVLENDAISPVTVESVRLMRNQISAIEVDAFR